ncbi:MAG: TIGR01777 family protein [Bacteroidetes bacterium]|nr:TIGR01777 family protein [Bacteroidota bacterium]
MKVVLAGATGFLGTYLVQQLVARGDSVTILTRRSASGRPDPPAGVRYVIWNGESQGEWKETLSGAQAVVNLSGESMAGGRWTRARKQRIRSSRIGPTRALVEAMRSMTEPPAALINVSAVGYYGSTGDTPAMETEGPGSGFVAETCVLWEAEARAAAEFGVRVVLPRLGVVLGNDGGALPRMTLPFRFYVGGPIGSGKQWFPWVHRADIVGAILMCLDNDGVSGPINVVAPESVTMVWFSKTLGEVLGRPSWMPVPGAALRVALGEMSGMILEGRQIVPGRLLDLAYPFAYPKLLGALKSLYA